MAEPTEQTSGVELEHDAPEFEAVDEHTYEATRPHLRAALEQTLAMGRTVQDWAEFCIEKFGSIVTPYLQRLTAEIREQTVRIEGLGDAAKQTLFGTPLAPEQREQWIREAAFFRAEQRGFTGGSADEDWAEAEREVERCVTTRAGLVSRGRMAVISLSELGVRGFEGIREMLTGWMERRGKSDETPET